MEQLFNLLNLQVAFKKNKIELYFCILACIGIFLTILASYTLTVTCYHSDLATAHILSKEQLEMKSFFPKTWVYAQELWIIHANLVISFLSLFMKDHMWMRAVSNIVFFVAFLVSLFYMYKNVLDGKGFWIASAILSCGLGILYYEPSYMQVYIMIPIQIFILLMSYLSVFDEQFNIINKKHLMFLCFFIIYLFLGGNRWLAFGIVPLLAGVASIFILDNINNSFISLKTTIFNMLKMVAIFFVSMLVGYVICSLIKKSGLMLNAGVANLMYVSLHDINVLKPVLAFFINFGYEPVAGVPLFSLTGIFNFIIVIFSCFVFFAPFFILLKHKEEKYAVKLLFFFNIYLFGIVSYVYIFMQGMNGAERYFLANNILSVVIFAYIMHKYVLVSRGFILKFSMVCFVTLLILSGWKFYIKEMRKSTNFELVEFLKENNLKFGYASYWNSYKHTVMSNFNTQINAVNFDGVPKPFLHLTSTRYYSPSYYEGKSFLMFGGGEKNHIDFNRLQMLLGAPSEIKTKYGYEFYIYDYNIVSKLPSTAGIFNMNILALMACNEQCRFENDTYVLGRGGVLFGPYIKLFKGVYSLSVTANFDNQLTPGINIISNFGNSVITRFELQNGENNFELILDNDYDTIEFVVSNSENNPIKISSIKIHPKNILK